MSHLRSPFSRRVFDWLPELLFLAVTTAVGLWAGGRWLDPTGDPGFAWSLAYRLAEGDALYRDVYLAYGPLSPYLLAGLGWLFDFSAGYVVGSSWIAAVVAGVLLLRCGRPFLSTLERIAAAGLILAFSLWAPGPGRLVFPYYPGVVHALALSLVALLVVRNRNPRLSVRAQCGLAGLLSGLAFLAKQEIGVAVLIALLASLVLRSNELFSRGALTVAAFAIVVGVALGAVLLVPGVTLDSLRNQNHVWPLDPVPPVALNRLFRVAAGTISPGWAFGVREAAWRLLVLVGLLATAGLLAARSRKMAHWLPILGLAFALLSWWAVEIFRFSTRAPVALSTTVAFLVAAFAFANRRLENREHLVAIATFAGLAGLRAVFSHTLSGAFDGPAHFATSLTWVAFLCVVAPRILAPEANAAAYARRMTAIFVLVSAWNGARLGAEHLRFASSERLRTLRGTVFLPPSASFFRALAGELRPGEKVLVLPEISAVDVLFGARSVSPLLDVVPGWFDVPVENELLRRLEASPPDAVVVFNRSLYEYGAARFGDGYGQRIAAWIEQNYRPVLSEREGSVARRKTRR